jgi:hypothetical protein
MRDLLLVTAAFLAVTGSAACRREPSGANSTSAASQATSAPAATGSTTSVDVADRVFTGAIAETMDSGGYTYARLQGAGKDVWVAAPQFDAKVGETISVSLDMPMEGFQSKTLNRTFPLLYFVQEVGRNGQPLRGTGQPAAPAMMPAHGSSVEPAAVRKLDPPSGGLSVADVFAKKASLTGKPVTVRGTVVKFNAGILDRNWLHIQDGSGTADTHDNDLTITTDATVKVGDVVTMTGVVGLNKDFGAGYAYDVIVEKASLN